MRAAGGYEKYSIKSAAQYCESIAGRSLPADHKMYSRKRGTRTLSACSSSRTKLTGAGAVDVSGLLEGKRKLSGKTKAFGEDERKSDVHAES